MREHDGDLPHNPFNGLSSRMTEHLRSEVNSELTDLGELQHVMHQIEGKAHRRTKRIYAHMQHCGECLSEQIKTGMLIQLPDYWELQTQAGGGRYPKLHYQVN